MTLNFDVDLSIFNIKKALLTHSQRVSLKKRFSHKDRRKKNTARSNHSQFKSAYKLTKML